LYSAYKVRRYRYRGARDEVKGQKPIAAGRWDGEDIHIDAGVSKSYF